MLTPTPEIMGSITYLCSQNTKNRSVWCGGHAVGVGVNMIAFQKLSCRGGFESPTAYITRGQAMSGSFFLDGEA